MAHVRRGRGAGGRVPQGRRGRRLRAMLQSPTRGRCRRRHGRQQRDRWRPITGAEQAERRGGGSGSRHGRVYSACCCVPRCSRRHHRGMPPSPASATPASEPESAPSEPAAAAPALHASPRSGVVSRGRERPQRHAGPPQGRGLPAPRASDVGGQLLRVGDIAPNPDTGGGGDRRLGGSGGRRRAAGHAAGADGGRERSRTLGRSRGDKGWCQGYVAGAVRNGFLTVEGERPNARSGGDDGGPSIRSGDGADAGVSIRSGSQDAAA